MTTQAAQTMPELPVALASIHADGYWTTDDRRPDWKWPARQRVFSVDQMHQYARDYAAMLAADTVRDSELEEREQEWGVVRPLILQRVNAHDALVSALRDCVERLGVVIESDTDDALHGASPDDVAAYEAGRAALAVAGVHE